ncbi:hypothetical protein CMUS01_13659, partial [Colletotrichum musicola]
MNRKLNRIVNKQSSFISADGLV